MEKKLRVSVEGLTYDVTFETLDPVPYPSAALHQPVQTSVEHVPLPEPPAAMTTLIKSPLAGVMSKVLVVKGQSVKGGDHVATLEAMKVYNYVFSPRAGIVQTCQAAVGQQVKEGEVLLTLEPIADTPLQKPKGV